MTAAVHERRLIEPAVAVQPCRRVAPWPVVDLRRIAQQAGDQVRPAHDALLAHSRHRLDGSLLADLVRVLRPELLEVISWPAVADDR